MLLLIIFCKVSAFKMKMNQVNKETLEVFRERLRNIRVEKGLTQEDMGYYLDIRQSSYAKYENGKASPHILSLVKISIILQVSIDYLLGRTDNKKLMK